GHAMLARTGFRDDARLAQAAGQKNLADAVVDLMGARMVEVFALEPDLRAAELLRPALCVVDRTGTTYEVLEFVVEFFEKFRIVTVFLVSSLELVECMHQRFGHEGPAKTAEMPLAVR